MTTIVFLKYFYTLHFKQLNNYLNNIFNASGKKQVLVDFYVPSSQLTQH